MAAKALTIARVSIDATVVGVKAALDRTVRDAQKGGRDAGKAFGDALSVSAGQGLEKASRAVAKFTAEVDSARVKSEATAKRVAASEKQLAEAVEKGGAESARALNVEARLIELRQKAKNDTDALAESQKRLAASEKQLQQAQEAANRHPNQPRPNPQPEPNDPKKGPSFLQNLGSGAAQGLGVAGMLGTVGAVSAGIGGVALGFKKAIDTGVEFTNALNTMKAVSEADAGAMALVAAKARELGNDITLPATSANDAALAMTELAKGGFSVKEAMDAAKGSLQLAAASGVSAGEAAEIQSQLLHAFGLAATEAPRAADVLANAANQSSAEITDIAYGMQQAGTVAHGFKISMEDTATALAMLSNSGIQGSDAGTSLKTFLSQLADPSRPAANALEDLGVQAFDAQGKFVGLKTIFGELSAAARRMTDEDFTRNAAKAFGTDAIRGSMVAAQNGAAGWDALAGKITKAGAASEVAAAKTQGLPGALERLKNSAESVALTVYDKIKAPVEAVTDLFAKGLGGLDSLLQGGGSGLLKGFDLAGVGQSISGVFATVKQKAGEIVGAVAPTVGPYVQSIKNLWNSLAPVVAGAVGALKPVVGFVMDVAKVALPLWVKGITAGVNAVTWLVNAVKTGFGYVQGAVRTVGDGFSWLGRNVVGPVLGGAKAVIDGFGKAFDYVFRNVEQVTRGAGNVLREVWGNTIGPVVGWIGEKVGQVWNGFVKPAFEGWMLLFQRVGAVASEVWEQRVKPVWDGFKSAVGAVWEFVKPVFDQIGKGLSALGDIAKGVGEGIKRAFDGVVDVLKAPLHLLGRFLSGIPTTIGGMPIPILEDMQKFGATLQGLKSGGVAGRGADGLLWGPGTGTSDSILGVGRDGAPTAMVSAGEMVVNAEATKRNYPLLAALNAGWVPSPEFVRGLAGFAGGGVVGAEGLNPGADNLRSLIMRQWPEIKTIGGRRSEDGFGEHSSGNAIDIMIPNWNTEQGRALGDQIAAFLRTNQAALGLNGFIWRQNSFGYGGSFDTGKPMSDRGSPTQNHFDHVHAILGAGRGASAAPVGLPTSSLTLPGGSSFSGGAGSGGPSLFGSSGGSSGSGGITQAGVAAKERAQQNAQDRVDDTQFRVEQAQRRVDELKAKEADPKKKVSERERLEAEHSLTRAQREHEQAVRLLTQRQGELADAQQRYQQGVAQSPPGGKAAPNGNFGELGQIFGGFLQQTLGIDGSVFENFMNWTVPKTAVGLVNMVAKGAGQQGAQGQRAGHADAGGAGGADPLDAAASLTALVPTPEQFMRGFAPDDFASAATTGSTTLSAPAAAKAPEQKTAAGGDGGFQTIDNSIHINASSTDGRALRQQMAYEQNNRMRGAFATTR